MTNKNSPQKLSPAAARKLVLLSQQLPHTKTKDRALAATYAALQHLGYIQIDTISVVARAHHHTLWNRSRRYQPDHLAQLLADKKVFEYWSHAAAYLPLADYRFCLPRMRAFADGARHWFAPDKKMMREVRARIAAEGALRARDFVADGKHKKSTAMWDWKPAKRALEQLFMQGELMTLRRDGFNKVYDLTERVLPADVDTRMPGKKEFARFLITRFLRANGLGRAAEIAYLRGGVKPSVESCMADMEKRGEIIAVQVKEKIYYALPASLEILNQSLSRKRLKILSPFDNLLIQRERMRHLFNFDYQIECYTPAAKRKHGYFSLPILWDAKLVARMDCKADRKHETLIIRNLVCEETLRKKEEFVDALVNELKHFAAFNQCNEITLEKFSDKAIQKMLTTEIKNR